MNNFPKNYLYLSCGDKSLGSSASWLCRMVQWFRIYSHLLCNPNHFRVAHSRCGTNKRTTRLCSYIHACNRHYWPHTHPHRNWIRQQIRISAPCYPNGIQCASHFPPMLLTAACVRHRICHAFANCFRPALSRRWANRSHILADGNGFLPSRNEWNSMWCDIVRVRQFPTVKKTKLNLVHLLIK